MMQIKCRNIVITCTCTCTYNILGNTTHRYGFCECCYS